MCGVCGCGQAEIAIDEASTAQACRPSGPVQDREVYAHAHDRSLRALLYGSFGSFEARPDRPASQRLVRIEQDILSKNDAHARENRRTLASRRAFALNVVSSPGSGKTTLLVRTIGELNRRIPVAVIEGDQQTSNDAERIRATGEPAIQINTGKGCHLDAHMVGRALESLALETGCALFIENVGNLVCPAAFDLGEARRVVVFSVTEGEDKPLKYPDIFMTADLMLLNKSDLLPHLDFDVGRCLANALRINPNLQTLIVSAKTGEGIDAFAAWIEASAARHASALAGT